MKMNPLYRPIFTSHNKKKAIKETLEAVGIFALIFVVGVVLLCVLKASC